MNVEQIIRDISSRFNRDCNNTLNIDFLWGEPDDIIVISEKLRNGVLNNDRKLIYDHSAFCNIITKDGSLLNVAIKSRNVELVKDLILLGSDLNKFSGIELNNAVAESENEIIRLLLTYNIMIDVSTPKLNPLFTAIRKGNYDASKMLMEYGIDASIKYTNEFMKKYGCNYFGKTLQSRSYY